MALKSNSSIQNFIDPILPNDSNIKSYSGENISNKIEEKLFTITEVALLFLKLSKQTIYNGRKSNVLKFKGSGDKVLFKKKEMLESLEKLK